MGCPYEGNVPLSRVVEISTRLFRLGCYELSLGDTIGVGTPGRTFDLITAMKKEIPVDKLAVHFHDTYGQALSNILTALQVDLIYVNILIIYYCYCYCSKCTSIESKNGIIILCYII